MDEEATRELISAYLSAFERGELEQCMQCFDADATVEWLMGEYRGKEGR